VVYRKPGQRRVLPLHLREWYRRTAAWPARSGVLSARSREGPASRANRIATMALNHHRHLELYYAVPARDRFCIRSTSGSPRITSSIPSSTPGTRSSSSTTWSCPFWRASTTGSRDRRAVRLHVGQARPPATKVEPICEYEALLGDQVSRVRVAASLRGQLRDALLHDGHDRHAQGAMFTHGSSICTPCTSCLNGSLSTDPANQRLGEAEVPLVITPLFHAHAWGAPFYHAFAAHKMVLPACSPSRASAN